MTDPAALFAALQATWPPARRIVLDPFVIRDGRGGGKRVSAATATGPVGPADLEAAEQAMIALNQPCLFTIRDPDDPLDGLLDAAGYRVIDPTLIRACPIGRVSAATLPRVSAFTLWEPLQIMRDIWAEGGIGPARLDVMARVPGPRTAIFARSGDKPSGVAFVALSGDIAMVHAVHVRPASRRQGAARNLMTAAAQWAEQRGATTLAIAVTESNVAANALYTLLGMPVCAMYHYRIKD